MKEFKRVKSEQEIAGEMKKSFYMPVMDLSRQKLPDGWWPITAVRGVNGDILIKGEDKEWHKIEPQWAVAYRRAWEAYKSVITKGE